MVLSFRVTRYLSLLCLKDQRSPSLEKTFCEAKLSCCNHCSRNSSDLGVVLSIAQELWPYNRKLYNIWCKAVRIADPHLDTSSANDSLALACSREVQDCFRKMLLLIPAGTVSLHCTFIFMLLVLPAHGTCTNDHEFAERPEHVLKEKH